MIVDVKLLLERCSPQLTEAMQEAAALASGQAHGEVLPEHLFLAMCSTPETDLLAILDAWRVDAAAFAGLLERSLEALPRGAAGRPVISHDLVALLQQAWLVGSLEFQADKIRTGFVLLAQARLLRQDPGRTMQHPRNGWMRPLRAIALDSLRQRYSDIVAGASREATDAPAGTGATAGAAPGSGESLQKYCVDLTERARRGEIDPVFGREDAMRRIVDILARRRKNNPLLVGDAGVGKTAVVEGLALRLVEAEAQGFEASGLPTMLKGVRILALDMGALEAGAGLKGEFEERLKAVVEDLKALESPAILFIDEAHTLIGAGGRPGADAANFLKPTLARGELKLVAATTWSEHKRVFSRDAALSRRFQPVPLEEPSPETTVEILRGLKPRYEADHGVTVRDDAVVAAARFASRYIPDRFLPDKAVDLLDTAAARVKVSLTAKPAALEQMEQHILDLRRRIEALTRDKSHGLMVDEDALTRAWHELKELKTQAWACAERWRAEQRLVEQLIEVRGRLQQERTEMGMPREATRQEALTLLQQLNEVQQGSPLVCHEVDPGMVAQVVHEWTGIPLASILQDQYAAVLQLEQALRGRVKGQGHALEVIIKEIQAATSGLKDESAPMAVFLLAGPSGVGKTETARALAELLFGGEQSLVLLNMGEYSEKHSVSRLIGSPPGYVGYGEGGVLTEAVRRRPHSLVLLDEAEKAHPEVLNLFHQVFEQGTLSDAEGRPVDFRNVLFILTTNVGAEAVLTEPGLRSLSLAQRAERLRTAVWPSLREAYPASLLSRMTVAVFAPLEADTLAEVAERKLARLAAQALVNGAFVLQVAPEAPLALAARCWDPESGARSLDRLLHAEVLPRLAEAALNIKASGQYRAALTLTVDAAGAISVLSSEASPCVPSASSPLRVSPTPALGCGEPEGAHVALSGDGDRAP
ncbi:MAG: type VI secretion system ATPase TssH [Desulfovibrio sp.]|nr:type VI secretion system ATPase TssH [Desulfovibrio sp.]MCA1986260.1 type VI secretion system ATPase TssH [Desulfovibrio sp.]